MAGNFISKVFNRVTQLIASGVLAMPLFFATITDAQPLCGWRSAPDHQNHTARVMHQNEDHEVLYLPVVFHIVLQDPSRIADELIGSQLQVINEDFSRTNADATQTLAQFKDVAGSPSIQFYLASNGGERGITRTSTVHGPFSNDDLHVSANGGKDGWDSRKVLNVWVADLGEQVFGYGASPGSPAFKDGIAVSYKYFGRSAAGTDRYNLGRTLTHEIGHWLGLQHPWGNGGCNSSDGIDDTPLQDFAVAGCDLQRTSCGTVTMVQNFMNTSYDACMNLFTRQQCAVMRTTLKTQRTGNYEVEGPVTSVPTNKESWSVFPNPLTSGNIVTIHIPDHYPNLLNVALTDIVGKPHPSIGRFNKREIEFDFTGKPDGVYLATISGSGVKQTEKIIVHRQL